MNEKRNTYSDKNLIIIKKGSRYERSSEKNKHLDYYDEFYNMIKKENTKDWKKHSKKTLQMCDISSPKSEKDLSFQNKIDSLQTENTTPIRKSKNKLKSRFSEANHLKNDKAINTSECTPNNINLSKSLINKIQLSNLETTSLKQNMEILNKKKNTESIKIIQNDESEKNIIKTVLNPTNINTTKSKDIDQNIIQNMGSINFCTKKTKSCCLIF